MPRPLAAGQPGFAQMPVPAPAPPRLAWPVPGLALNVLAQAERQRRPLRRHGQPLQDSVLRLGDVMQIQMQRPVVALHETGSVAIFVLLILSAAACGLE